VDSIVLPHQIRTISALRVRRLYGRLADPAIRLQVREKVLHHLGFEDPRDVEDEP
jgi:hypothetical protein